MIKQGKLGERVTFYQIQKHWVEKHNQPFTVVTNSNFMYRYRECYPRYGYWYGDKIILVIGLRFRGCDEAGLAPEPLCWYVVLYDLELGKFKPIEHGTFSATAQKAYEIMRKELYLREMLESHPG